MQITETRSEGLQRELAVVVPASDLDHRLSTYLEDLKSKVRLNGFRPGKVPVAHLRKLYGKAAMAEIVNEVVSESIKTAVEERQEKPALQPDIDVDQKEIEKVVEGKADLAFTMKYEVLPTIDLGSFDRITVEKPVAEVTEKELQDELTELAERNRSYAPKDEPAGEGDKVKMSFVGRIGGEPFEGGSAEDVEIVLGSGRFIPGFEEQLTGVTPGDERTVGITFPEDYPAETLAGKQAEFEVEIAEVSAPEPIAIDDALAERLGLESLDKLKEVLTREIRKRLDATSRERAKRDLLDKLDAAYTLELPQKLVESEFEGIWDQVTGEMEHAGRTFADENTTEEAARTEYRAIAERRVKLGLILSEIGENAKVDVTEDEVKRALVERVQQFPGREKEVFDLYTKNPRLLATLRAPIFEDKVVDYLFELVNLVEKPVSRDELLKVDEADQHAHDHPHDHDHPHGHSHDHDHEHPH